MKKFFIFLFWIIYLFSANIVFWEKSVTVSAIVWAINHSPVIKIISPNTLQNPWWIEYVQNWTAIAIDFLATDSESDNVYFTISTSEWVVSAESWWPYQATNDENTTAMKRQFLYLAPVWTYWMKKITITVSDWISVSVKELNVYIY